MPLKHFGKKEAKMFTCFNNGCLLCCIDRIHPEYSLVNVLSTTESLGMYVLGFIFEKLLWKSFK